MEIIVAALVIVQALDVISTYKALQRPGVYEANKIMAWLMGKMGVLPGLIVPKVIVILIAGAILYAVPHPIVYIVLGLVICRYIQAIVGNYRNAED